MSRPVPTIPPSFTASGHVRLRLLAVLVTVLWSSSWVLIRKLLDDGDRIPPLTFAGLRYGLAAVALGAWIALRRPVRAPAPLRSLGAGGLAAIAGLGVVQFAITQGAQFVAIDNQPAATTNLLLAATPLLVAAAGTIIGEPMTRRQLIAGAAIIAGSLIYFTGDLGFTAIGLAAALIGLGANAASALFGRAVNRSTHLDAWRLTATTMSVGAAVLVVAGLMIDGVPRVSLTAAAVVAWLAVVNTALAFTWWNICLRRLGAAEMAAINTLMSVQIPVLAWIFLDEAIGVSEAVGITIVAGAVASVAMRRGREADAVTERQASRTPVTSPSGSGHQPVR
jgi:drug/metabolite transporter (DMT)-like permease